MHAAWSETAQLPCVLAAHVPGGYGGLAHAQALLYAYMAYVEHNL